MIGRRRGSVELVVNVAGINIIYGKRLQCELFQAMLVTNFATNVTASQVKLILGVV